MESKIEIRPGRVINLIHLETPGSETTIFFIHGLGGRSAQWRDQVIEFKSKYNLVIPDLLGHGKSDSLEVGSDNPFTFLQLEQDLQAIFNKYSTQHNIVIGHSYGGAIATAMAVEHQDKVNKLILISPTPCTSKLEMPFIYHLPVFLMTLLRPWMDQQFQERAFDESANLRLISEEMQASKENDLAVIKAAVKGMKEIPTVDVTMLTIPTLIMVGEHDEIIKPAAQQSFYEALPHHQFKLIVHASHMVMLEKPDVINKAIEEFLN